MCEVGSLTRRGTVGCGALHGRSGCCGHPSVAGMVAFRAKSSSRYVPRVFYLEV